MKPGYREHARDRMAERGITEADVEHALANFRSRVPTPKNSVRYIGPGVTGRSLKVWVLLDDHPGRQQMVKSVAWEG